MLMVDNGENGAGSGGVRVGYPPQFSPMPAPAPVAVPPASLQPPSSQPAPQQTLTPAPSPAPSPYVTPTPYAAPAPAPAPSFAPPAPAPGNTSNTGAITNPNTGQTASSIGSPQNYNIAAGIDTSTAGLLPDSFNIGTLTGGGTLPDANAPSVGQVVQSANPSLQGPTAWNVTAPQTVAGQYAQLMQGGNPAIQAAEEAVVRRNAASGGGNNLMTQSAAALAGSQVALQIATQDAQTNAQAGQFNATQANDFAKQQNQFVQNASLSAQNFQQGVAMLKDQTNQSMQQIYAQVQAGAATASINLKASLDTVKAQMNATMEQMDKQFSQNVDTLNLQQHFADQNAWTTYGFNVRTSYLASVNQQQAGLMQTIAEIRQNPNINSTQADAAIKDAVDQFNSFMTMNNSYYSSMVPAAGTTSTNYTPAQWPHG